MIAFKPINTYDVLQIPSGWDCFVFEGWLYRRRVAADGLFAFFREKWVGSS